MPTATAPPRPRRTQESRRTATRLALLDAAAGCLVEHGYAGTTTTVIVARAGVSQGALFRHFPTKADLLAATAAHLYEQLVHRYVDRFRRLERESDPDTRLDRAVRLLWKMFESPEWAAALDLTVAARTDADLRVAMASVVDDHAARIRAQAAAIFPELTVAAGFAITLDLLLETMVGMAVSRITDADTGHYRRLLEHLTELAHERLADALDGDAS